MNRVLASALALAIVALPLSARARPQAGSAQGDAPAAAEELEFVGDDEGTAEGTGEAMPLPDSEAEVDDKQPPLIEDLAVAVGSPTTPPMITAVITDDWSGIERADIYFRRPGESEYQKVALNPGSGGLFIGRLPDGIQSTGFEYYVEVWDAAKNGPTRMGEPERPYPVEAAAEGTLDRIARQEREALEGPVHPGWVMLAMGAGIAASAFSGVFWYDLFNVVQPQIDDIDGQLGAGNLSAGDRAALEKSRAAFENSRTGDVVFGSILGVVGVAALGTGAALMIASIGE